jgi:hypothetical protein
MRKIKTKDGSENEEHTDSQYSLLLLLEQQSKTRRRKEGQMMLLQNDHE